MASEGRLGTLRGQIAPITAITLFGLSVSISFPLFAVLLERMGVSGAGIGLNQTGAALAIVVFAPLMPVILARVGLARLMLVSTVLLAAALMAAPLWQNVWYWAVLRIVLGFAGTALFYASEYWIVGAAPDSSRGRIVALYTVFVSGAFMAGPMILRIVGIDGVTPFLIAAGATLAGVVPILWGRDHAPPAEDAAPPSPFAALRFFRTDPSIVWGVTLFGMIEFGALGLIPVWAVRSGMAEGPAVTLLAFFAAGSIAFQWPLGHAADRHDRRLLLLAAGIACLAAPAAMVWAAPVFWILAAAMVLWGGLSVGLYSLALTEMGARYRGVRLSEANAAIILGYGFGAVGAPVALGSAMDLVPPHGVLWLAAIAAAAYVGLLTWRIHADRRKPLDSARDLSR